MDSEESDEIDQKQQELAAKREADRKEWDANAKHTWEFCKGGPDGIILMRQDRNVNGLTFFGGHATWRYVTSIKEEHYAYAILNALRVKEELNNEHPT